LRTFRKCGNLHFWDLRSVYFLLFANQTFCTILQMQIRFFILTSISIKMLSFKFRDDFWLLGQFWGTYYLVGKENIRGKRIWIRNTAFSLQIFGFAICRLGRQGNLPICDLQINRYNFDDLRFADWHVSENFQTCDCGMSPRIGKLAIWELPTTFCAHHWEILP